MRDSIVSVLRATAKAQAAENGDATDEVPTMSFKGLRYIKGVLYRMIKNLGACPDQAAPALTFCIPANSSSADDKGTECGVARSTAKNTHTTQNSFTYRCRNIFTVVHVA